MEYLKALRRLKVANNLRPRTVLNTYNFFEPDSYSYSVTIEPYDGPDTDAMDLMLAEIFNSF